MLRESHSAVLARNERWEGDVATEPYEAGWAIEALIFMRALHLEGGVPGATLAVQISPDGMHWVDEGTRLPVPARAGGVTFARVHGFGTWLRVAGVLPPGVLLRPLVTFCLKG